MPPLKFNVEAGEQGFASYQIYVPVEGWAPSRGDDAGRYRVVVSPRGGGLAPCVLEGDEFVVRRQDPCGTYGFVVALQRVEGPATNTIQQTEVEVAVTRPTAPTPPRPVVTVRGPIAPAEAPSGLDVKTWIDRVEIVHGNPPQDANSKRIWKEMTDAHGADASRQAVGAFLANATRQELPLLRKGLLLFQHFREPEVLDAYRGMVGKTLAEIHVRAIVQHVTNLRLDSAQKVEFLLDLLDSCTDGVPHITSALCQIPGAAPLLEPALLPRLERASNPKTTVPLINALTTIKARGARSHLLECLQDGDPSVRHHAARALGDLFPGDPGVFDALAAAQEVEVNDMARAIAFRALTVVDRNRAVERARAWLAQAEQGNDTVRLKTLLHDLRSARLSGLNLKNDVQRLQGRFGDPLDKEIAEYLRIP